MSFENLLLAGLALIVLWVAWRMTRFEKELRRVVEAPPASLQLLQSEVQAVRRGVDERLREHTHQAHELSQRIGQLQKATASVEQLGAGLSELQKMLQPPQLRGAFGERLLEELLADALPREYYQFQYCYTKSGARVDAAVFLGEERLLPIDSKFPLDNFRRWLDLKGAGDPEADSCRRAFARDVSHHVDAIASKYIVPDEGTLDIAFMYIPSESVFHEIIASGLETNGVTLAEYAQRRRVIPVSPNTLHAYMTVVRMGLKGFQLQHSARELLSSLTHLQGDVEEMRSDLDTAIKQARHSLGNVEEAEAALSRVEQRLLVLGGIGETPFSPASTLPPTSPGDPK